MWSNWVFEDFVDSELWEFMADSLMKFVRVRYLIRVCMQEVDVQVETAASVVGYGFWEGGIGTTFTGWLWVYERFSVRPISDFLAADVLEKV